MSTKQKNKQRRRFRFTVTGLGKPIAVFVAGLNILNTGVTLSQSEVGIGSIILIAGLFKLLQRADNWVGQHRELAIYTFKWATLLGASLFDMCVATGIFQILNLFDFDLQFANTSQLSHITGETQVLIQLIGVYILAKTGPRLNTVVFTAGTFFCNSRD